MCWKVNIKTIVDRGYELDIKNPNKQEEYHEFGSLELLGNLRSSMDKSNGLLAKLIEELK